MLPSDDVVIDLRCVTKVYRRRVRALDEVSLQVRRGEIVGLLGPNGAGKTTLVKILTTVVRPTHCDGALLGRPVGERATLARVGYLPEAHRLPEHLTAAQALEFYAALSGVPRHVRRRRAAELLDTVGLRPWAGRRLKTFSKGMRQRVGLAQALMHEPDLLLLDEPTDGVDPVGRRDIRDLMIDLRRRGRTILLNSHLLSEVEMVCDRVAILVQGRVRAQGRLDDLTTDQQHYEIEVEPSGRPLSPLLARVPGVVAGNGRLCLASGRPVVCEGSRITVATGLAAEVQPILDALRAAGLIIRAVRLQRPSLEELFMQIVDRPGEPPPPAPPVAASGTGA